MKILKSNTNEIFDTDDVTLVEDYQERISMVSNTRHLKHELADYDLLQQYFPLNHSIFEDSAKSFYYILPKPNFHKNLLQS
jgi:hypothetical protein